MPAFKFRSILLHTMPNYEGWEIYGVLTLSNQRVLIATFLPIINQSEVEKIADRLALALAGMPHAEID